MISVITHAESSVSLTLLEVNSQVWSPHLLKDIRRLEAVYNVLQKKLVGLHALTYTEHLDLLGLGDELERIYYLPTNFYLV